MDSIIPNNLARLRRMSRLSQRDVTKLFELYSGRTINISTVCNHENSVHGMSMIQIQAYARIFKVPAFLLFKQYATDDALAAELRQTEWVVND